jgi:predicted metal-binding membrane protein
VAGVVLGSLVILAWAALTVRAFTMASDREEDGSYATSGMASVETLRPGDCFSGVEEGTLGSVTIHPCTTPQRHSS